MTVMYSFCFWFSVRLGSILVGLFCMGQATLAIIACAIGKGDPEGTVENIDYWQNTNDLMFTDAVFEDMKRDPNSYYDGLLAVLSVYCVSCLLLIWGAFKCNMALMLPFIVLDFARLVILTASLVVIMMLIKRNSLNLGLLIGGSVIGTFSLIYLWYQWFCTIALWQIIRELKHINKENNQMIMSADDTNYPENHSNYYTTHTDHTTHAYKNPYYDPLAQIMM